ncbi:hypothetical protein ITP53_39225 [Nonomuraea sp. K274]|uniref:Uncharacterized protein n=1 Tax=Nonomuraea cypriaca TaxID=1187855 RepID=A0A931AEY1_9ACTN|nr:hypothetical protein [Nonomuraea cypriaca]MBF8191626.1 hypothetical protein [Nonomuraea cypriaca]
MPSFERLTIEEARTLTREELLPRIEEEQKYWYHRIHRCLMQPGDDAAFRTFNDIMHIAVDPHRSAAVRDAAADENYWRKPLGELGEL